MLITDEMVERGAAAIFRVLLQEAAAVYASSEDYRALEEPVKGYYRRRARACLEAAFEYSQQQEKEE